MNKDESERFRSGDMPRTMMTGFERIFLMLAGSLALLFFGLCTVFTAMNGVMQ